MSINNHYLDSIKKQFLYYKTLGEKAMNQLEPEQLFISVNDDTNSIAVIVKHLSGNMISRWTDFLTSDGEKKWRRARLSPRNSATTTFMVDVNITSRANGRRITFYTKSSLGAESDVVGRRFKKTS